MFRAGLYTRVSTNDQQTLVMQNRALREYAARRGWTLAYMRYQGGVDTQLNALDADRDLLQAKLDLRQIKLNELLSVVQLYKALGGGWQR
jgi:outer membrane protein TolC